MTTTHATGRSVLAALILLVMAAACGGAADSGASGDLWGPNSVTAAELVKELAGPQKPTVICTAPPFLYRMAHIPGAVLHGPAADPAVLDRLTTWAKTLPKTTSLVIYCGCCPMRDCPNVRPAYAALKNLGFEKVRVLILPDSFRADWIERGYPMER